MTWLDCRSSPFPAFHVVSFSYLPTCHGKGKMFFGIVVKVVESRLFRKSPSDIQTL